MQLNRVFGLIPIVLPGAIILALGTALFKDWRPTEEVEAKVDKIDARMCGYRMPTPCPTIHTDKGKFKDDVMFLRLHFDTVSDRMKEGCTYKMKVTKWNLGVLTPIVLHAKPIAGRGCPAN